MTGLVGAIALPDGTAVRGRGRREPVPAGPLPGVRALPRETRDSGSPNGPPSGSTGPTSALRATRTRRPRASSAPTSRPGPVGAWRSPAAAGPGAPAPFSRAWPCSPGTRPTTPWRGRRRNYRRARRRDPRAAPVGALVRQRPAPSGPDRRDLHPIVAHDRLPHTAQSSRDDPEPSRADPRRHPLRGRLRPRRRTDGRRPVGSASAAAEACAEGRPADADRRAR